MQKKRKILVCPLNWGLGHATRMVPVIEKLIRASFKVVVAASGESLNYLKSEFEGIEYINLPGYSVNYSRRKSQVIKMIRLFPRILFWTIKEHYLLKNIIKKHDIDIVVSDNRFGLWNNKIKSVFITHQLRIKFPKLLAGFEFIYNSLVQTIIKRYSECWVPDFPGEYNISGELSHVNYSNKNLFYIGPLSRFEKTKHTKEEKKFDIAFILSGPEPQRTILEDIIVEQLQNSKLDVVLVRGTSNKIEWKQTFPIYNLLNTNELIKIISKSEIVICRSGYTSVMDLIALEKKAVLVPTPGQTEQEYLADYLKNKGLFFSMKQQNFDINCAVENCFDSPNFSLKGAKNILGERIQALKR